MKRELYLSRIRPYYELDFIKVIVGIRRAGKSKILEMIMNEIRFKGVDSDHMIHINFEDMDYRKINDSVKLNQYVKQKLTEGERYYIFLDEIQHVAKFEEALASLKATTNSSIFVTGSNSKLLSGKLATLLTGRTVEFTVFPFTYKEACDYMALKGLAVPDDFFNTYLKWGGFPQMFDFTEDSQREEYLRSLYNAITTKDIFGNARRMERNKFERVSAYVLANCGTEVSCRNIAAYLNNDERDENFITSPTVCKYVDMMEKAFLVNKVKKYNIPGKEVMSSSGKQYAADNGFRVINTNTIDYGTTFFLENIVYNELRARGYSVFVGKTYKGEVDFVAIMGGKKCFIQVAYLLADEKTVAREFGAFQPIHDASPKYVISLDPITMSRDGITHLRIQDFLAGKVDLHLS